MIQIGLYYFWKGFMWVNKKNFLMLPQDPQCLYKICIYFECITRYLHSEHYQVYVQSFQIEKVDFSDYIDIGSQY